MLAQGLQANVNIFNWARTRGRLKREANFISGFE